MILPFVLCLALAVVAAAQEPRLAMEQAAARQRASIESQRASVERQRTAVRSQARTEPTSEEFFTIPWEPLPGPAAPPEECDAVAEEEIGPIVKEISAREGLTPDLLRAVIEKESAYLPCAVSPKGAQGLMQLMPETAVWLGVLNPFDPRQNVEGGARFLKSLLDRYGGNLALALAAYNAGPRRVDAIWSVPAIPETTNYVNGILQRVAP